MRPTLRFRRLTALTLTANLFLSALWLGEAAFSQTPAKEGEEVVFRSSSNLVLVTVFVRDKKGQPVTNLSREDFTLAENGKAQKISVFDFQQINSALPPEPLADPALLTRSTNPAEPSAPGTGAETPGQPKVTPPEAEGRQRFRDRRLLVLFFDWSSLPQADQIRAKDSAEEFIRKQMTGADLVSLVSFTTRLKTDVEFTGDREALLAQIKKYQSGDASELAGEQTAEADAGEDAAFTADDTEFNIFNTDRKLAALEDTARRLAALPEKKALIYFSSGVSRTGGDNESQLRATINAAVRANVSFYPIDVRGLTAEPPGGGAATAAARGTGLFSGQTQTRQRERAMGQQDTLNALAADTGGKALLDENDLSLGITQAQQDLQSYYVLGYYSGDERKDGQFRRVEVKLSAAALAKGGGMKLEYRSGYFAEKDFKSFNRFDKERQLEDALLLGDPVTDLSLALEVNWFRFGKDRYFVPVAVKIPGSAIPLAEKGDKQTTQFDFIGQIISPKGGVLSTVRDAITIQLRDKNAGKLASSSLLYETGFTLAPGEYRIKMLVRENRSGRMGTYESRFTIPDLNAGKEALRLSSVVWSNQQIPIRDAVGVADKKLAKKQTEHPLVRGDRKVVPSVTRVFRPGQKMMVFAEAYDPATNEATQQPSLAAMVSLYQGRKMVAQSQPVRVSQSGKERAAAPFLLELPLQSLTPGEYTAQLTVVDEEGQKFATARAAMVMLPAASSAVPANTPGPANN